MIVLAIGICCCRNTCPKEEQYNTSDSLKNLSGRILIEDTEKCEPTINYASSILGVIKVFARKDTLDFISDKDLTWRPLSDKPLSNAIKLMQGDKSIDTFDIIGTPNTKKVTLKSTLSNMEFLLSEGKEKVNFIIVQDPEIIFTYGIRIGMTKKDFINLIDSNFHECLFEYNVFKNFDPPGEYVEQSFLFKNDSLNKIFIKKGL